MITHTLLLDSHILIWVAFEPHRLKESAYRLIVDAENLIVSQASLIELSFKHMSGTLLYTPDNLYEVLRSHYTEHTVSRKLTFIKQWRNLI